MKTALFRLTIFIIACLGLSLPLCAQTPNRVVAPVDEAQRVTLTGNVHPLAQARFDRGPAPVSHPTGRVMLVLRRSAAQQLALTQYLGDLQNPSSPNYHKWLTPAQYGAKFGISDNDLASVQSWLQTRGFTIEKVPQARNVIEFSGNFGQIQSAFHTSIHQLLVNGESHFANMSDPQVPAALAPVVAGVGPLNDFHPKPPMITGPQGRFNTATQRIDPAFTLSVSSTPYLFADPADAATIYDTPNTALNANYTSGTTYDGTGVSIGIGGVSDITTIPDIQNYRTGFLGETTTNANLPTMVVDGTDPGLVPGWDSEALLDNEVSGGLAPGAKIYFYTSADTDVSSGMLNAIYRALDDNKVSILSLSVQACEVGLGNSGNQIILEGSEQAAAQGITVVVAAGDNGSAGCDDFDTATAAQYGFAVNGFASSPWVVAVGGTDFDALATNFSAYANATSNGTAPYWRTALKYIPENPWNDSTAVNTTYQNNESVANVGGSANIVAGSGGVSSCVTQTNSGACTAGYSKPSFQVGMTPADTVRDVPDVSLLAANGQYQALWVLCSDSVTDGSSQPYTECDNTNGQFSSGTYFGGVGGTSAAAPAFAGMLALVAEANGSASDNYRLGQADFILYKLAQSKYSTVFHDVVTGNNSVSCQSGSPNCGANLFMLGYNAGANYDLASGLGSVDVNALVKNWNSAKLTATATSLKLNGSTAAYTGVHGANVTFDVGVNPTSASGLVAIVDNADETPGGTASGPQNDGQLSIPLASGAASAQYNGLPGGSYTVTARYGGDAANAASTSVPVSVTIAPESSTTALSISASNPQTGQTIPLSSIPYGSAIFADATITGSAEGSATHGIATGYVNFNNGISRQNYSGIGTGYVASSNIATWSPRGAESLRPSTYNIFADYLGDPSYSPSTSSTIGFAVVPASTVVVASADPTTVSSNANVTVTAMVETPWNLAGPPTDTVSFSLGGKQLESDTLVSTEATIQMIGSTAYYIQTAAASFSASSLKAGTNTFTIDYSGDGAYTASSTTVAVSASAGFSFGTASAISVTAGAISGNTSNIDVIPYGGFKGKVNLTCAVTTTMSNPHDPPTCKVTSPVAITGTTDVLATLTVNTTASTTSGALASPLNKFFFGGGAALALMFFFGVPARRRAWRALFSVLAVILLAGAVGCGGGGGGGGTHTVPGTTPGIYTVTVTGKDAATGQITANTTVPLDVN